MCYILDCSSQMGDSFSSIYWDLRGLASDIPAQV